MIKNRRDLKITATDTVRNLIRKCFPEQEEDGSTVDRDESRPQRAIRGAVESLHTENGA